MEIIVGGNRFEKYLHNAHWANVNLDTFFNPSESGINDLTAHFNDCVENPTRGMLAKKWSERTGIHYPVYYERNLKMMLKDEKCKQAFDTFEQKTAKMYPKTLKARKFLVDNGYVVLNYVKEHEKSIRKQLFKLFGR